MHWQEMALHDNAKINNNARGALFSMGIIPRPSFSDSMSHIMLSFAEPQRPRVTQLKTQLEDFGYVVWMDANDGQMEEQFLQVGCLHICAGEHMQKHIYENKLILW